MIKIQKIQDASQMRIDFKRNKVKLSITTDIPKEILVECDNRINFSLLNRGINILHVSIKVYSQDQDLTLNTSPAYYRWIGSGESVQFMVTVRCNKQGDKKFFLQINLKDEEYEEYTFVKELKIKSVVFPER